ncbi:MAG: thioesterase family protein [Rhodocyclaceae bacterium]|nr:thioesterase family protein [Rhodocyclaceae bacterium]
MSEKQSIFTFDGSRYMPTDWAVGPWDPQLLHGGATATLLAHGIEATQPEPDWLLAKLNFDFFRPIRKTPMTLRTEIVREGKRVRLVDAFLAEEDVVVARASGFMVAPTYDAPAPLIPATHAPASWQGLNPVTDAGTGRHLQFNSDIEFRPITAPFSGPGIVVWVKAPYDLLPGTPLTPTCRTAAMSDFANAIGIWSDPARRGFINADIALSTYRRQRGDWLCLESAARPDGDGIAVSNVLLYDEAGLFGSVSTVCLAKPMKSLSEGAPAA